MCYNIRVGSARTTNISVPLRRTKGCCYMGKKHGDRKDGTLVRDLDGMHFIMPIIYPNRCDNEAFISERIDLTNAEAFLEKLNAENPEYKYNLFQLIVMTVLKTITLRPKMNRFIANRNMYQRNEVSAAFVVKKLFDDKSEEGLAIIHAEDCDTLHTVHNKIYKQVTANRRTDERDSSSESMDIVSKLPRFVSKSFVRFVCMLDRHGKVPASFIETDPYYTSCVISNLGSIKLHSGYHHLTNWGTTSVFCAIGEKKKRPFFDENGNAEMRMSIDLGLTIDERLADGYYYSKTVRLIRTLLENPELLEKELREEVEY